MAEETADNGEAHPRRRAVAGEGVAQVVKPDALQLRRTRHHFPRSLEIAARPVQLLAGDNKGAAVDNGHGRQNLHCGRGEHHGLGARL